MPTYRTQTFGCKVNQYETREIEELLEAGGLSPAADGRAADLVVVNTCVVTAEAARQCRQTIRRMRRENPRARLIVTGCYAAAPERDDLQAIEGLHLVTADKAALLRQLAAEMGCGGDLRPGGISRFAGHTRAFVKIQDGCNQFCSYCIIPHVRGRLWSRPSDDVVDEVQRLIGAGHREIVLSGIHLGRYGRERSDEAALVELLARLVSLDGLGRIRLSSIEIVEVTDDLLALMAARPERLCAHLHVPLQSGDDAVLRAMRRPYTAAEFLDRVRQIRRVLPHVALTTDVIVGFPGETDAAFDNSCRLCREAGFSRVHVFPYSPRAGTPAAEMPDQVPREVRQKRSAALRGLGHRLAGDFARSLIGRKVSVLVETLTRESGRPSLAEGFDEHYVRTRVELTPAAAVERGHLLSARVVGSDHGAALARPE
ncbi:MAG: tRNA (N(6)-L-threonylcarbamoyladenosine(37)-C(2))-methylthiotransferase MtaB [Planctomycetes bacterium]|nr:tRNA (N(6)-L-threonylcarbamoyladenosine(37)-C(2))-methylthiotransferase MtaB [Planctomycetota bacterium]